MGQPGRRPRTGAGPPQRPARRRRCPPRLGADADLRRHRRQRPALRPPRRARRPPLLLRPLRGPVPRQGAAQPRPARHPQDRAGQPRGPAGPGRGRDVERAGRRPPVPRGQAAADDRGPRRDAARHRPRAGPAAARHAHRRPLHGAQPAAAGDRHRGRGRVRRVRPGQAAGPAQPHQQPPGGEGGAGRVPAPGGVRAGGRAVRPGPRRAAGRADRDGGGEGRAERTPRTPRRPCTTTSGSTSATAGSSTRPCRGRWTGSRGRRGSWTAG